jgi:hypothetical protein
MFFVGYLNPLFELIVRNPYFKETYSHNIFGDRDSDLSKISKSNLSYLLTPSFNSTWPRYLTEKLVLSFSVTYIISFIIASHKTFCFWI